MKICPICNKNECHDDYYCPSCEATIVKLGSLMQSLGVTAEEASLLIKSMCESKEEVDE